MPAGEMPNRLPALAASALLAFFVTLLAAFHPFSAPDPFTGGYRLQLAVSAPKPMTAKFHPDNGAGLMNAFSQEVQLPEGSEPRIIETILPNADLYGFGLVWARTTGPLRFGGARILDAAGKVILQVRPEQCIYKGPAEDIAPGSGVHVATTEFEQPFLTAHFPMLPARQAPTWSFAGAIGAFAALLLTFFGLFRLMRFVHEPLGRASRRVWAFAKQHPRASFAVAGLISVFLACHPVIFFGKSFVSPANGHKIFYDKFPTVAGAPLEATENPSGVDFGGLMTWGFPVTATEHNAIFRDGEIPFWNRHSWSGTTLLGQVQGMVGDPLHWLPLSTGGAAWAWDLKFVLARWAFAIGIGFLAWAACRHFGVSLLMALSAPWIGFFTYRGCHPAVFTMCYAPWILVAWLEAARSAGWRAACPWAALLIVADWWLLSSGTAKEASAMLLFLNLAGALALVLRVRPWKMSVAMLGTMTWASVIFLLLSAPQWLVFLDALGKSFTVYDALPACQIQPGLIIGLFDDLFHRQVTNREFVFNPGANFLVLIGVLWLLAKPREALRNPIVIGLLGIAAVAACFAFGVISPSLLKTIPFLKTVHHFDNTFSCVLIVLLFPLAAIGLRRCVETLRTPGWWGDWGLTLAALAGMLAMYFGFLHAAHRVGFTPYKPGEHLRVSGLFTLLAPMLVLAFAAFAPALRSIALRTRWRPVALAVFAACAGVIHFRHGQWLDTRFDRVVFNPKSRFDLRETQSSTFQWLQNATAKSPARILGLDGVLIPGISALYGMEEISGADALDVKLNRELIAALKLPIVWDWRVFMPSRMLADFRPQLDFLNVGYYLAERDSNATTVRGLPDVFAGDLLVHESPTAWPRAFFTDTALPVESAGDVARLIVEGDGRPFAAMAPRTIGKLNLANADPTRRLVVNARDYRLTANSTQFAIEAPSAGIAILHENFSEGDMQVEVDDEPSVVLRVNHAFRAVPIAGAGHHVVRFWYEPAVWPLALRLAETGAVLVLLSLLLMQRRQSADGTLAAKKFPARQHATNTNNTIRQSAPEPVSHL